MTCASLLSPARGVASVVKCAVNPADAPLFDMLLRLCIRDHSGNVRCVLEGTKASIQRCFLIAVENDVENVWIPFRPDTPDCSWRENTFISPGCWRARNEWMVHPARFHFTLFTRFKYLRAWG